MSATFRPDPGEHITCTFLNQDDATISFVKDVESATDPTKTFAFSGPAWVNSSPYGDGQGESETISDWSTGRDPQTVSETRLAGWSESVSCTGDAGDTSVDNADTSVVSATFRPDPGEHIECTFLNQDDATVSFVKDVESATEPNKTFAFSGGAWVDSSPYGDGQGESQTISDWSTGRDPQTVSETRIAGWSESVSCTGDAGDTSVDNSDTSVVSATFRPDPGEHITCTFLNQDDAEVSFVKDVESAAEPNKTFVFSGGAWVDSSPYGDGQGESQTISDWSTGRDPQTVSETRIAGWSESVSCTGDAGDTSVDNSDTSVVSATFRPDPGEHITCTFLNQEDATISFVKDVESATEPNKTFAFSGPAWVDSSPYGDGQGETETITSFPASDLTVSETRIAGWSESVSCTGDAGDTSVDNSDTSVVSATFRPDPGEHITCTFLNQEDATVSFVKDVVSATEPNKTFAFSGPGWVDSSPYGDGQGETETITSFPAQDLTVSETRIAGWSESVSCTGDAGDTSVDNADTSVVSATFRPDPGEHITCTFLNEDDATISFVKDVESATEPNKTFAFTGGAWVDSSPYGDGQGESQTISDWSTGRDPQTVSETRIAGWSESVSCTGDAGDTSVDNSDTSVVSATFRPDPGEHIECTFLNQDDATVSFVKDVESATDPTKTFAFSGPAWVNSSPYGDGQGETETITSFPAQAQTVSETRIAGWSESVSCSGDASGDTSVDNSGSSVVSATFRPDPGEHITCTFLNQDDAAVTVIKNAAPESGQDFGFSASGLGSSSFTLEDDGNEGDEPATPGTGGDLAECAELHNLRRRFR